MTEMPYQNATDAGAGGTAPSGGNPANTGAGDRPAPPYRRLRRSRDDRMLAGVCAGVADYLRVDPTLVRVGLAVLTIVTWGVALLAYLVAWLLMPEE